MIDTMPAHFTVTQVRALHPRAMIIRWDRKHECWVVFHRVDDALGHPTAEPAKSQAVNRPVVMNRSW